MADCALHCSYPHPEERPQAASRKDGQHGSPGDAKHRPETREDALLTMRDTLIPAR
jgi:hypothetical protein